jgi:hypothetical protein
LPTKLYLKPKTAAEKGCVTCHDAGAWQHSPFIDQVHLVPSNGGLPHLPVGRAFQQSFRGAELLDVTTEPVGGEPQKCTSCHRMTSGGFTCNQFIDWSTGQYPYALSESSKRFPQAAWMPLNHGLDANAYESAFGAHIERMKCCCQNPMSKGCLTRPLGPTLDDLGDIPPGQSLPDFQPAPADGKASCQ